MADNMYVIITPYFPSKESHIGSYIYDQAKAISNTKEYKVRIIKLVSFFSTEKDYNYQDFDVKVFKVFDLPFFTFFVVQTALPLSFQSFLSYSEYMIVFQ